MCCVVWELKEVYCWNFKVGVGSNVEVFVILFIEVICIVIDRRCYMSVLVEGDFLVFVNLNGLFFLIIYY